MLSPEKKARIKAMGGRLTTAEEWLDLTAEEVAVIDMKIRRDEELNHATVDAPRRTAPGPCGSPSRDAG